MLTSSSSIGTLYRDYEQTPPPFLRRKVIGGMTTALISSLRRVTARFLIVISRKTTPGKVQSIEPLLNFAFPEECSPTERANKRHFGFAHVTCVSGPELVERRPAGALAAFGQRGCLLGSSIVSQTKGQKSRPLLCHSSSNMNRSACAGSDNSGTSSNRKLNG